MNLDCLKNIEDYLEILQKDLLVQLDDAIAKMKLEHSARGILKSGGTIKCVMSYISEAVESYYSKALSHTKTLPIKYTRELETQLFDLAKSGVKPLELAAYKRLKDATDLTGRPELYERMRAIVEKGNQESVGRFRNLLNGYVIEISKIKHIGALDKFFSALEPLSLLAIGAVGNHWISGENFSSKQHLSCAATVFVAALLVVIGRYKKP